MGQISSANASHFKNTMGFMDLLIFLCSYSCCIYLVCFLFLKFFNKMKNVLLLSIIF